MTPLIAHAQFEHLGLRTAFGVLRPKPHMHVPVLGRAGPAHPITEQKKPPCRTPIPTLGFAAVAM